MPKSIPIACVFKAHGRETFLTIYQTSSCLSGTAYAVSGYPAAALTPSRSRGAFNAPRLNALEVRGRSLFFRSVMLQQSGGVRVTLRGSLVQRGIAVLILRIDVRSRSQQ